LALPHTLPVVGVTFLLVMTQDPPRAGGAAGELRQLRVNRWTHR
jgi:hypothetical protein